MAPVVVTLSRSTSTVALPSPMVRLAAPKARLSVADRVSFARRVTVPVALARSEAEMVLAAATSSMSRVSGALAALMVKSCIAMVRRVASIWMPPPPALFLSTSMVISPPPALRLTKAPVAIEIVSPERAISCPPPLEFSVAAKAAPIVRPPAPDVSESAVKLMPPVRVLND